MTKTPKLPEPEWHYPVKTDEITSASREFQIEANSAERLAMAERVQVVAIDRLKSFISLTRQSGHIIHATGRLEAQIVQNCVLTAKHLENTVSDDFEAWYADENQVVSFRRIQHEAQGKKDLQDLPMLDESEDPEPVVNGQIDLGELTAQFFSLAIPSYPCDESAKATGEEIHQIGRGGASNTNPFAALKDWRPKD